MKIIPGGITASKGFKASGVSCEIKEKGMDLALIFSEVLANAAGVFTTNKVKAAPVFITMENLEDSKAQAIIANSGCANACTGERGLRDARLMAELVARALNIEAKNVIVASTGLIGTYLPMGKIEAGIQEAVQNLSYEGGSQAAQAIMTTDRYPKETALEFEIAGKMAKIGGIAKGAGMISPDMATMLCFITTDIAISPALLKDALKSSTDRSFNCITVDGDTSTNDMVVILANGLAGNKEIKRKGKEFDKFQKALDYLTLFLAKEIVKNAEGATKLIEISVKGANSYKGAREIAKTVANSNLVKTALFGKCPNWGRIMAAVGRSGVELNPKNIDIYLQDLKIVENGMGAEFSEGEAKEILGQNELAITIDLQMGEAFATVWTCDLSYDYVRINAEYPT